MVKHALFLFHSISFSWRDVHTVEDFLCLARESEKRCPGERLPLRAAEPTTGYPDLRCACSTLNATCTCTNACRVSWSK